MSSCIYFTRVPNIIIFLYLLLKLCIFHLSQQKVEFITIHCKSCTFAVSCAHCFTPLFTSSRLDKRQTTLRMTSYHYYPLSNYTNPKSSIFVQHSCWRLNIVKEIKGLNTISISNIYYAQSRIFLTLSTKIYVKQIILYI